MKTYQYVILKASPKALDGINLTIPAGKFTAIVGENGAGKSTFFDLLVRLHTPDEGSIIIDGVDSRDIDLDSWRENIGIVSQEPFLFHASIWENIAFGRPDASREEIFEAARMARVVDFAESMADGYDTIVGNRGTRLSGGQRMRVAIATAFLRKPRLLLLDEITSSLDSESEHEVMKAVEALKGDSTIIAISHRLSSVRSADNIFVLKSGKLVEQGTHEELISKERSLRPLLANSTQRKTRSRMNETVSTSSQGMEKVFEIFDGKDRTGHRRYGNLRLRHCRPHPSNKPMQKADCPKPG